MKRLLSCVVALAAVAAVPVFADVTNGLFQPGGTCPSGFCTLPAGDTSINGWKVTAGSVDWIGSYWQAPPTGGFSVDLDGLVPGEISQTLNLSAGSYILNFYLAGNPDGPPPVKDLQVSASGSPSELFTFDVTTQPTSEGNMGWELKSYQFTTTGAGSTIIAFTSLDPTSEPDNRLPAYGPVVGGVSLTQVPEAGFYAYSAAFALGLSAFLMLARRKRAA